MKIRYKSNIASGIFSIILGAVLLFLIPTQISAEITTANSGITSSTLPTVVGALFIVCGIALLVQSLIFKIDTVKELEIKKELWVCAYMALLVLYGFLFKYGFIWTTAILAVATLAFTRCKNKWYYIITVGAVLALYFLFSTVLHVRLP